MPSSIVNHGLHNMTLHELDVEKSFYLQKLRVFKPETLVGKRINEHIDRIEELRKIRKMENLLKEE